MTSTYRALIVSAHPDDIEFGCAGTVAKWVSEGADVTYCIVTDGSTGTQDRDLMGARLNTIRKEEAQRAAEIVGVNEIVWLDYPDGYVEYTLDLRRDIARVFRGYQPHRFVVMDTAATIENRFINHPDHRAVGHASLDVTLTAGTTPGHFPELLDEDLEPWRGLSEVWIMGPAPESVAVDISKTIDLKLKALACHESQLGPASKEIEGRIREWAADLGKPHGFTFAETFKVIAQGPGFHPGEQEEGISDLSKAPTDPRSNKPPAQSAE